MPTDVFGRTSTTAKPQTAVAVVWPFNAQCSLCAGLAHAVSVANVAAALAHQLELYQREIPGCVTSTQVHKRTIRNPDTPTRAIPTCTHPHPPHVPNPTNTLALRLAHTPKRACMHARTFMHTSAYPHIPTNTHSMAQAHAQHTMDSAPALIVAGRCCDRLDQRP